jgi:hypothetical protein
LLLTNNLDFRPIYYKKNWISFLDLLLETKMRNKNMNIKIVKSR